LEAVRQEKINYKHANWAIAVPQRNMKKLRFVIFLITEDNDYQRHQATAAKAAGVRLETDLEIFFAGNDAILQSQQLLDVIARKDDVKGILVEPAGRTAFPKAAEAAVTSGIAWVVLNSDANYLGEVRSRGKVPVFSVSIDNHEVGRIQGRQLGALLPKGGLVLYIQGPSQSTVTEQRSAGMFETKPANVNVRVLKSANWTQEGGFHAASSWLRLSTARQEAIDLVQAQNDSLAVGARRAMEEQRKGSRLPFLGVDGIPQTGQAWIRQGVLAATVVIPAVTPHALEALVAAMAKQAYPPEKTLVAPASFPAIEDLIAKSAN
jgi:ribose transport system substrate-binding protein